MTDCLLIELKVFDCLMFTTPVLMREVGWLILPGLLEVALPTVAELPPQLGHP